MTKQTKRPNRPNDQMTRLTRLTRQTKFEEEKEMRAFLVAVEGFRKTVASSKGDDAKGKIVRDDGME